MTAINLDVSDMLSDDEVRALAELDMDPVRRTWIQCVTRNLLAGDARADWRQQATAFARLHTATAIMAEAYAGARGSASGGGALAGRLDSLIDERRRHIEAGNIVMAREASRTIEDLSGHWRNGVFVDAVTIDRASALTQRPPTLYAC